MKMLGDNTHNIHDNSNNNMQHHNNNNNDSMMMDRYDVHPQYDAAHHSNHMVAPGPRDDEPGVCAGCGAPITERYYLLAVDKQWHADCLKCSSCHLNLDAQLTCFAKDGEIFCKEDYYRKFAVKACSRCQMGISAQELVMRARNCVYHLHCFSCAACNKLLNTGEHFGMKGELIFCKLHYEMVLREEEMAASEMAASTEMYYGSGNNAAPHKGRPRKRKHEHLHDLHPLPHAHMHVDGGEELLGDYSLHSPRQKRIRTSFKHHQLRILKSYFALNQNPDAKDLKQLSQKTGLTKRVLQVWFQNARAKYRRNVLKDCGSGGEKPQRGRQDSPSQDSQNTELLELSRGSSPPLTDMSSTPSLPPDYATMDAGDMGDRGAMDHGVMDRGAMDHGAMDHGAIDHGAMDRGAMDRGAMDHGAMDHGAMDRGAMDHGAMDRGAMDHGAMERRSPHMASLSELFNTSINHMT